MANEITAKLRDLTDSVSHQLIEEFNEAIEVVATAAAAGLVPTSTAASVVDANAHALSEAFRQLPKAVARLDAVAALAVELLNVVAVESGSQ